MPDFASLLEEVKELYEGDGEWSLLCPSPLRVKRELTPSPPPELLPVDGKDEDYEVSLCLVA